MHLGIVAVVAGDEQQVVTRQVDASSLSGRRAATEPVEIGQVEGVAKGDVL